MLNILNSFDSSSSTVVALGFDSETNRISTYNGSSGDIENYDLLGNLLDSIPRPGERANDFDISYAPESFILGNTNIAAGTLLAINGESGTTDIYAVDKNTGAVITTLATEFGTNHIVGGAYHPQRDTIFLAQDRLTETLIAEIDPITGGVLNTFSPGEDFSIYYGDLEISDTTGNLFVVSSSEDFIRELTPTGTIVQDLLLPNEVSSLSGIGLDETMGEIWVASTGGEVWQLDGLPDSSVI